MQFQWYIINLEEGTIEGTNDVEQCEQFIENDDYLILTAQHGIYYLGSRKENKVHGLATSESNEEEEDED